ncbi:leucine-rich_repeat domain-containing protein [Hexamita inflata]|uniref:Leucine-rich repeat domain-containing protein n=1 Tax=Hexamita inflata TaxID=28002 RepID=A0AA86PH23_9EUKA|nr:leucine-rich repeat domain-containing protein [Hexamita inflata]
MLQQNEAYNKKMIKKFNIKVAKQRLLEIQWCSELTDLDFVTQTKISEINISECCNIVPVVSLKQLMELSIKKCKLERITLVNMQQLLHLDLQNNSLKSIQQINQLKNQVNLTYLDLSGNQIVDISQLRFLSKLFELYLEKNEIADITALNNLKKLQILHIYENKIVNVRPLKELQNLEYVDLCNNLIVDISTLKGAKFLQNIKLKDNKVINLEIAENVMDAIFNESSDPFYFLDLYPQQDATEEDIRFSKKIDNIYKIYDSARRIKRLRNIMYLEQQRVIKYCLNQQQLQTHHQIVFTNKIINLLSQFRDEECYLK